MAINREVKIKSGRMFEYCVYPVWKNGARIPERAPKTKPSTKEQKKYNAKTAAIKFARRINLNFDTGDVWFHPTLTDEALSYDDAKRIMTNYLRRWQSWRRRNGYIPGKWAYKIGLTVNEDGRKNYHYHIFLEKTPREVCEDLWTAGERANADRYMPDRWGQEAAAIYTGRREQGPGRYVFSRSCKKLPPVKPRDGAISNARLEKLARYRVDDREYWEKKFPGHKFDYCESTYNSYNGHWYLRVVMRRLSDEELRKGRDKKENAKEI